MGDLDFEPVIDADQHYYEPLDAFTRHRPTGWADRTVQRADVEGRTRYIVGGKINRTVSNPTFDPIVKAGAMMDYFRGNPDRKQLADCLAEREPIPAHYRDRDERLKIMDEQKLESVWMLPTLGMAFEEDLQLDPEAAGVAFHAFNQWIDDDWGFNYQDRIYGAPYLAMGDIDNAVEKVEWALAKGARLFAVRPTGTYTKDGWRSPGDEVFDPIWARLAEAGALLVPHTAEVGAVGLERFNTYATNIINKPPPPLQIAVGHERPIANYIGALVCGLVFERHPDLRVVSVENGAEFLPLLIAGLKRADFQRPGYFTKPPVQALQDNVWVVPFWEDNLGEAVEQLGADRIVFGSDYPHAEGLAEPRSYEKVCAELNDPVAARKIMYGNVKELMGTTTN